MCQGVDMHDAQHFRLSPTEALMLDPQTRLLLEVGVTAQGRYKVPDCRLAACMLLLNSMYESAVQRTVVICLSNSCA